MRKYWDEAAVYSQPSTSILKRNAKESMQKQQKNTLCGGSQDQSVESGSLSGNSEPLQ